MSYSHIFDDIVIFSSGIDNSIDGLSKNYINANDQLSIKLKKAYYAVMVHAVVDSATIGQDDKDNTLVWGVKELSENIKNAWSKKGNGRAILMLSCYAGFAMARPLAINLKLPVVAGRSAVTIEPNGTILCVKMADASRNEGRVDLKIGNRLDWVFVKANGELDVVNSAVLDKTTAVKFAKNSNG